MSIASTALKQAYNQKNNDSLLPPTFIVTEYKMSLFPQLEA